MLTTFTVLLMAAQLQFSPAGETLLNDIDQAITQVQARHATLPTPADDAERLRRMGELDQAPRKVITTFDFSKATDAERAELSKAAGAKITEVDQANEAALVKMLPAEGWFYRSKYGDRAASAAFDIVQHGSRELRTRMLPVLEPLVATGEVDGQSYALMFDRVATAQGRPQRYGSQFRCDGGKWRPYPLEDATKVEALRQTMGFRQTFAAERARFQAMPTCPQTGSPPPAGMKLD